MITIFWLVFIITLLFILIGDHALLKFQHRWSRWTWRIVFALFLSFCSANSFRSIIPKGLAQITGKDPITDGITIFTIVIVLVDVIINYEIKH